MSRDDGYNYCSGTKSHFFTVSSSFWLFHSSFFATDRGMGLAMWKSEESYLDVQYIVGMVDEDTFTALLNPDLNECRDGACDRKLVRLID